MGKGKAKGWRPPAAGEAANSMLFGSADHLTGDTIASPVQLREEGKKIPVGHVNYGGNWGAPPVSGAGKGKGTGKETSGAWASSTSAPRSKAPSSSGNADKNNGYCAPSAKGSSSSGPKANPFCPAAAAEQAPAASSITPAVPKFAEDTQKAPAGMTEIERRRAARLAASNAAGATSATEPQDGKTEIERRREARAKAQMLEQQQAALAASEVEEDDASGTSGMAVKVAEEEEGMTEIERRRRAREAEKRQREEADEMRNSTAKTEIERRRETMLQLERALAQETAASDSSAAPPGEEEDGFETRRRALEERRLQAEKVAREAEARRREASRAAPPGLSSSTSLVGEAEVKSEDQLPMDGLEEQPAEMDAEADMEPKEEDDGELAEPPVKRQTCAAPGAMQQGLQSWVDRMNALAEGDEALLTRCREFVRKRILQAHADGNVHTNNWADEPLPSLSDL